MECSQESDQRAGTHEYVQKHKLNELFAHFLQLLLYHRPDSPRAFLCEEIKRIREEKVSSSLFTEKDLETMFDLIDVTKQRWITLQQLRNTYRNLATAVGENEESETVEELTSSAADSNGHVTLESFKKVLSTQLLTHNVWS